MHFALGARSVSRTLCCGHFSPYRFFVDRESRTVVVINPKVGSSTLRRVIAHGMREVRGMRHLSGGRYWPSSKARNFPVASVPDYLHALSHPREYLHLCFVRNPYARLRSAWLNKLAFGHVEGYPRGIRGACVRAIRRCAARQGLPGQAPDSPIPFDTFLSFVESQPHGSRDHHWDLQCSVLLMDAISYDRIYRMETEFTTGITDILARLSLDDERVLRLLDKPANQTQRQVESVYDEDIARRVYAVYERDFEVLQYDPDSWTGL